MAPQDIQKNILADWFLPSYQESCLTSHPRLTDADATEQVCEECQATLHRRVADAAATEKLCEKFQATLQSRVADVIQQACQEFRATLPHMVADAIKTGVQQSAQATAANKANHDVPTIPQEQGNPLLVVTDDTDTESEDSSLVEEDVLHLHHNREHWDSGSEVELPEFHGGVASEDAFLKWLFKVEVIFQSENVPENRRVSLVKTCFHGHAAAWWNQFKLQSSRYGKEKLTSWDKLKKSMRKVFVPYGMLLQKFNSIRQGSRTVDEYATEFFHLLSLIDDKQDSEDQLVVRFIAGLEPKLKTMLKQFDPVTVSEARHRALVMEQKTRGGTHKWDFSFR